MQPAPTETTAQVVKYNPSDARIAEVKAEFAETLKNLPALIEAEDETTLKTALKTIVPLRTELERCRQALKEEALRHGQKIDAEARRLKAQILEFETPIQDGLEKIAAAQRARAEAKVRAEEEAKAAEAKRLADIDAEKKRVEDEQRAAEAKKLADERAAFEREKREAEEKRAEEQRLHDAQKAELEAQARKIKAEADRLAREKQEAEDAKARAEQEKKDAEAWAIREKELAEKALADAKAKVEREQAEKAEAERLRLEQEAAEKKAAEEARPDIEKIHAFGDGLMKLTESLWPKVTAGCRAAQFLADRRTELDAIAMQFQTFIFPKRPAKPKV